MACPECGSTDHIAVAQENGSLWLECLRCGANWKIKRPKYWNNFPGLSATRIREHIEELKKQREEERHAD